MTIQNGYITIDGISKKIKEDGFLGDYTFKLQKTQVRIRTVEEFQKSLKTEWVHNMFIGAWNNKYKK